MNFYSQLVKVMEFKKYDILVPFVCRQCGVCCQNYAPQIPSNDIPLIAQYLNKPQEEIIKQHKECYNKKSTANPANCIFLNENHQCSIYHYRPKGCQEYPFTDFGAAEVNCLGHKEFYRIVNCFDYYRLTLKKDGQNLRPLPSEELTKIYAKFMSNKPSLEMIKKFIGLNGIPKEIFADFSPKKYCF